MPYTQKTYEDIRNEILTDYSNQISGADISEGSDIYIRASVLASALWGIYQYQKWVSKQIFPDTSDTQELEHHAWIKGLSRKQANKSTGTVTLAGTNGIVVTAGLSLKTVDEVYFETTTGGTISTGVLDVTAQAKSGGISGNITQGIVLTIQDHPAGVTGASAKANFTGGTNAETDTKLLTRLLDIIRQPPAGGNANDYIQWALEVKGVEQAYVYSLRQGLGTVTVAILTAGAGLSRIPNQTLLDSVKTYIDSVRPVTVSILQILAPIAKTQDVTAAIKIASGYTFAQVSQLVSDAIKNYIDVMKPGETLYKSKIEKIISDVDGVNDRTVSIPSSNVVPVNSGNTIEMICPGTITITEMV